MDEMLSNLVAEIERHNQAYWVDNDPLISDEDYDVLMQRLAELAPDHPLLSKPQARQKGDLVLPRAMLSLAKVYTGQELLTWARSVARSPAELFRVGPKFDGCACIGWVDGAGSCRLATRGGEDLTDKLSYIGIDIGVEPVVGELVVLKDDLPKIRRGDGSAYKTCRSAAAGLLNSKEQSADLNLVAFCDYESKAELLSLADIESVDWEGSLEDVLQEPYPVDGIVVRLADNDYGESLGVTEHHPRHSVALKIKNPATTTTLLRVEWQVAATRFAPVAVLAPCEVDGVTITRATLHNLAQINKLGVRIGSVVRVERAGSVIPAITAALSTGVTPIVPPAHCPSCGAATTSDGQDVWCSAPETCPSMLAKRLINSLTDFGVENVGPAVADALVAAGKSTIPQVFAMSCADWRALPGFAEKSAQSMFDQFQGKLGGKIEDYKVLAAMNIPGIGQTLAKALCAEVNPRDICIQVDCSIAGLGHERWTALRQKFDHGLWLWAQQHFDVVLTSEQAQRPLICFTGEGPQSRDNLIKLAQKRGYEFHKGVTKNLALLVCTSNDGNSSKLQKARKYGIEIKTYEEWL